jgi:hypothetical protein
MDVSNWYGTLNLWTVIGMVVSAAIVFFLAMAAMMKLADVLKVADSMRAVFVLGMCMVFASYVTWAITSNNIPFLHG